MPYRHPIGDPIEPPADETAGTVRASIDIAAPADDVFRALSDPRELAAWLGGESAPAPENPPDAPSARPADGPPGRWAARVVAPDGMTGVVTGEYGRVQPPRLLETTWRASWNDFLVERVRFELVPIDVGGVAGTRVTVTHTRATARWLAPSSAFSGATVGTDPWPTFLARLAVYVATTSARARSVASPTGAPADWFEALHRAVVDTHHAR